MVPHRVLAKKSPKTTKKTQKKHKKQTKQQKSKIKNKKNKQTNVSPDLGAWLPVILVRAVKPGAGNTVGGEAAPRATGFDAEDGPRLGVAGQRMQPCHVGGNLPLKLPQKHTKMPQNAPDNFWPKCGKKFGRDNSSTEKKIRYSCPNPPWGGSKPVPPPGVGLDKLEATVRDWGGTGASRTMRHKQKTQTTHK